jgi:hypothetical protein
VRMARRTLMGTASGLSRMELAAAYPEKDEGEKIWRIGKGGRGLTGTRDPKRNRVESHLLVWYVPYLLRVGIRRRLQEARIRPTLEKATFQLRCVEMVKFRVGEKEMGD